MLRVISNLGKNIKGNLASKNIIRIHFSSEQQVSVESEQPEKTFDEKAAFFERFSNTFLGIDRIKEIMEIQKRVVSQNHSRSAINDELIAGLKEVYGKNYEKILNKRFIVEIDGHKDGIALADFELFPKNLLDHGKFENFTKNGDLIQELQQTTYVNIDPKETHKYVVPKNSHFSLLLDEFIPDEYVSELNDNQVCLFGFPKTCDEEDVLSLIKNEFNANYTNITIGECVLSLPAYAILTFSSPSEAAQFKQKVNSLKYLMGGRPIYATTFEDSRREHSTNRSLLVSGIRNDESINDLLNFLGTFGSVMHFEIVEEPLHSKLPTTKQVLDYLKTIVKEGDESIIYEITDISDGAPSITEYPPYNPSIEVMRDGKKLNEVIDEIEIEKERQQLLAKRQLIPRMVLNTWDCESLPQEYQIQNATPEQQKIFENIEKQLRTEYTNKQYIFITYSCTEQTKLAFRFLNNASPYEAILKKSTEHYHCDNKHQTSVFKEIKQIKGDIKIKFNDQNISTVEQDRLLAQSHEEMKEQLLEHANSQEFTQQLSTLLENEIIGKSKHSFEHQLHLKSDKPGREFSAKVNKNDLNQISAQFQDRQRKNIESMEGLRKNEEEILSLYKAKVMYADINKISHPYVQPNQETEKKVMESLEDQALNKYKIKQQEYLNEQQIRERWMDEAKEILEKKMTSNRTGKRKPRGADKGGDDIPDIKEPKEEEPDQYYAPQNDYIQKKKFNKYQRYVDEMQRLYDGDYSEAMKSRIFMNGNDKEADADGNQFVTQSEGEYFDRLLLSDEQFETLKYYQSISDVLPNRRVKELYEQIQESPDETRFMLNQTKLPTKVFDRSQIPELDENAIPISNEEFTNELNKYVAELGQHYAVQKDARGDEKIVMYENTPHPVPLQALNVDEIQLLRDCLTTYGFDAEATEREIQYFLKNGDYTEEVLKIVGSEQTIDEENELDALIVATGLSRAELESIMKLDFEKEGAKIAKSLQEQREDIAFDIKMGTPQPKDLIKTNNTKLRNKDKQGRYKASSFKFF